MNTSLLHDAEAEKFRSANQLSCQQIDSRRDDSNFTGDDIEILAHRVFIQSGMLDHDGWKAELDSFTGYVHLVFDEVEKLDAADRNRSLIESLQLDDDDNTAALRIGEGAWISGKLGISAVSLMISLIFVSWVPVAFTGLLEIDDIKRLAKGGFRFFKHVKSCLVKLEPQSDEFRVFESIHTFTSQARIVDFIANDRDNATGFGTRPPTTSELVELTGLERINVSTALHLLRDRNVVKHDRRTDIWQIAF